VSDSKPDPDRPDPRAQADADDEDRVDVDDLESALAGEGDDDAGERDAFEGLDPAVVARLGLDRAAAEREPDLADDDVSVPRRGRSPLVSLFVLAFAAYLLVAMFGDFRYWLRGDEPEDLGEAADLVASGGLAGDLHDRYVVLTGTPDVKNAAVGATKSNLVGYLRITEGNGRLFAAIPREKDQTVTNNFEGRFVGRMRKLSEDRAYPWLQQFYATEVVTVPTDVDVASLVSAIDSPSSSGAIEVQTENGRAVLSADQEIRLVVRQPDARVQLGVESFPTPEAADAAVAALGRPWVRLQPTKTFHHYSVRVADGEHAKVQAALVAELPEGDRDPGADPRRGALVLPRTATYVGAVGDLARSGDALLLPYGTNTTSPGYDEKDGRLVERTLPDGMLRIPTGELQAARAEQRIGVDPDGFLVAVGEPPSSERLTGILWLVVLGIAMANVVSLWVWWRRRAA
jgi:hypothetical protein